MKTEVKNISTLQTGLFAKPVAKGEVVYLQYKHFDEFGKAQNPLHPDLKADGISDKHLLKDGDVLFAAKGTKNFATVYEKHNAPAVASTSFFVIRLTDNKVLPKYLAWFLNQPDTQGWLKDRARGTYIPSIRKSTLEELEISIPSIEKQKLAVKLSELAMQENELRKKILNKRKRIIDQKIMNAIK